MNFDEAMWKAILENVTSSVIVADKEQRIQFLNRVLPGMDEKEILGKSLFDFVAPDHKERVRDIHEKARKEPQTYETEGAGPNNQPAWYSTRVAPLKRDGEVVGLG